MISGCASTGWRPPASGAAETISGPKARSGPAAARAAGRAGDSPAGRGHRPATHTRQESRDAKSWPVCRIRCDGGAGVPGHPPHLWKLAKATTFAFRRSNPRRLQLAFASPQARSGCHSGSPALRRPSEKRARSCGRRIGSQSVRLEVRRAGSSRRRRSIACRASSARPASA